MSQPNQSELDELIDKRVEVATTQHKSSDEVVQIAWLAKGIDIWHKTGGKRGHSPDKAMGYIISSITRHITANYTPNETVAERERLARIDELSLLRKTYIWNGEVGYYLDTRSAELKAQQEEV